VSAIAPLESRFESILEPRGAPTEMLAIAASRLSWGAQPRAISGRMSSSRLATMHAGPGPTTSMGSESMDRSSHRWFRS
jgi:hypothetical protein